MGEGNSLVLMSGGLDSFLSLLIATEQSKGLTRALFFNYGQNPIEEERAAVKKICRLVQIEYTEINLLPLLPLLSSPYTAGEDAALAGTYISYVPNRNLLFLTLASNYGMINGFQSIYTGFFFLEGRLSHKIPSNRFEDRIDNLIEEREAEEIEWTLHADQTENFLNLAAETLQVSTEREGPVIINSLEKMDKVDIFIELEKRGKLKAALQLTYSCYSKSKEENEWGIGCGNCDSCVGRKKAFNVFSTLLNK